MPQLFLPLVSTFSCLLLFFSVLFLNIPKLQAQAIIRDTEIENALRVYMQPLLQAAGIPDQRITVTVINNPTINAAVFPDAQMIVHSGLLIKAESPLGTVGVLAHELGHFLNKDIIRLNAQQGEALNNHALGLALGLGLALAGGGGEALIAGGLTGGHIGQRKQLAYSRNMEIAADRQAVLLLKRSDLSLQGLINLSERMLVDTPDPDFDGAEYMRTHPLTENRLRYYRQQHKKNTEMGRLPKEWQQLHERVQAKLMAFTGDIKAVWADYPETRRDVPAQMAHAIVASRQSRYDDALAIVERLLEKQPQDGFLHDLKGDILRNAGRPQAALKAYSQALTIMPWASLIRFQRASLWLKQNSPEADSRAKQDLIEALRFEPGVPVYWRHLAEIHRRQGNIAAAAWALTESSLAANDPRKAGIYARQVQQKTTQNDPLWLKADDVLSSLKPLLE